MNTMAARASLDTQLADLNALRSDPTATLSLEKLNKALKSKVSHIAAKAAQIIAERGDDETFQPLVPQLVAAFERFMTNPARTDKGCRAKAAIAEALVQVGSDEQDLFLRGIRHVQREPTYGGSVDTAVELRGSCALGLARMNYPELQLELADLLADPEPGARAAAARAIAYSGNPAGIALLRLRVRMGGDDAPVLIEYFTALLKLAPKSSLPFVRCFLDDRGTDRAEAAVLALGESRIPEALDMLTNWYEKTLQSDLRRTGLLAIAMLRSEKAFGFLLSIIEEGSAAAARDALAALAMYKHDEALVQRVRDAAERRDDTIRDAAAEVFRA